LKGILLLFFQLLSAPGDQWAEHLALANADAGYCQEFLELMEEHKDENPTAMGYYALATMLQAKRFSNPFTKLSYFNKGKKILEATIAANPENAELRFLRFAVQSEVPAILLYFSEIEEDQEVLDNHLEQEEDGLALRIRKFYQLKDIEINS